MRRFFVKEFDRDLDAGSHVTIRGSEARHMLAVLRMSEGERLILIDGSGTEFLAEMIHAGRDEATLEIIDRAVCDAEPKTKAALFQCIPKAGKMELIIQKCVELGINKICPVLSKRCVARPELADAHMRGADAGGSAAKSCHANGKTDSRLARFNRVAHEAAKQCGRGIAPEVLPAQKLTDCDLSGFDLVLIAYEGEENISLKQVLNENRNAANIAMLIGPEGGFEQDEVEWALASNKNARSVSLGKRILRTETAGMAMLAMLMYELEG